MKWFWILFATALEVLGDYFIKRWSITGVRGQAYFGAALYAIGTLGWAGVLKEESLQRAIVLFAVINLLAVILVGHFAFDERLKPKEVVATIFGVAAIILIEW